MNAVYDISQTIIFIRIFMLLTRIKEIYVCSVLKNINIIEKKKQTTAKEGIKKRQKKDIERKYFGKIWT